MKYFSYVCIMKSEQEQENYPGIMGRPFEVILNGKFYPWDILESPTEEYIVVSSKKISDGYITKLAPEDLILHKQFLWKYSQFMWRF